MRITFLGGGNMASAMIGGLLQQHYSAAAIQVIELNAEAREQLTERFGVRCTDHIDTAARATDVWVLAVKPQQMKEAIAPLAGTLSHELVISIAAGLRLEALQRWLGGHSLLVRCMPNTPALIGKGMTGLVATPSVDRELRHEAERILSAAGQTEWVQDESLIDAVTAISGSGPAYVFYFIESLMDAGIQLGLDKEQSRRLALATFTGAAELAATSSEDPATLRARVTSKGGTTEAALRCMDEALVREIILRAATAARDRGQELGDVLGA